MSDAEKCKCGRPMRLALGHLVCEGCNNHHDFCVCWTPAPATAGRDLTKDESAAYTEIINKYFAAPKPPATAGPVLTANEYGNVLLDYRSDVSAPQKMRDILLAHDAALRAEVDAGKRATLEACDLWRKEKDDYLREKARADAAEAEVERLTRERDEAMENARDGFARVAALERAIKNAPHGLNDSFVRCKYDVPPHICDCWKSRALEGK